VDKARARAASGKIIECRVQSCSRKRVIQSNGRVPGCECGNIGYNIGYKVTS